MKGANSVNVAIYARYSSDNQRDASIEDQLRVCREFADRKGWKVVKEYTDHALSGTTLHRPQFQRMLQAADDNQFEAVLAESLDRFSRDQADIAHVYRHLTFVGV